MNQKNLMILFCILITILVLSGCVSYTPGNTPAQKKFIPIKNEMQKFSNQNKDDVLDQKELNDLIEILKMDFKEPHMVNNQIAGLFDINNDNNIDGMEIDTAQNTFCFLIIPQFFMYSKGLADRIDVNDNGRIEQFESQAMKEFLFFDTELGKPHPAGSPWGSLMDANRDGKIDQQEIDKLTYELFVEISSFPESIKDKINKMGKPSGGSFTVDNEFAKVFDLNENNEVEKNEVKQIEEAISSGQINPGSAKNNDPPFYGRFDINRDGKVSEDEIRKVKEFLNEAIKRTQDNNQQNNEKDFAFPVGGDMDKFLDLNENGMVESWEFNKIADLFRSGAAQSGKIKKEVEFYANLDINKDNKVSDDEIKMIAQYLDKIKDKFNNNRSANGFPAQSDMDKVMDFNGNGMVEDYEFNKVVELYNEKIIEPGKIKKEPDFYGRLDLNNDGKLSQDEINRIRDYLENNRHQFEKNNQQDNQGNNGFPIAGDMDKIYDINDDGMVNSAELNEILKNIDKGNIKAGPVKNDPEFLYKFDLNKDNKISQDEIQKILDYSTNVKKQLSANNQPGNQGDNNKFSVQDELDRIIDLTDDGIIDMGEIKTIKKAFDEGFIQAGAVKKEPPFLGRFDMNRDNKISEDELKNVRKALERAAAKLQDNNMGTDSLPVPVNDNIDKVFDQNSDNRIDKQEMEKVISLFRELNKQSQNVKDSFTKMLDLNKDNFLSIDEITEVGNRVQRYESKFIRPKSMAGKPIQTLLDDFVNTNRDSDLDPEEISAMEQGLNGPHPVQTAFDKTIDFDNNGFIEAFEIDKALRAGAMLLKDNQKSEYPDSIPVATPFDSLFDLNNDKKITKDEVDRMIGFFLSGEHEVNKDFKLDKKFDINGNGFIDNSEMQLVLDKFMRPHPAEYSLELDKTADTNKNFFIEPEEIGIAAGVSKNGLISTFESLIGEKRFKMERQPFEQPENTAKAENDKDKDNTGDVNSSSLTAAVTDKNTKKADFQKKIDIKNKKIAIVDLKIPDETINKNFSDPIIMFVENAFVNIGTASVVDRQNISKIITEYKFQSNDLANEKTAVQIGKLAGAEIIVIGNLNYIGSKYYFNIKLISVETAEIIGSSIETAVSDAEFFDMCNNVVYKLF